MTDYVPLNIKQSNLPFKQILGRCFIIARRTVTKTVSRDALPFLLIILSKTACFFLCWLPFRNRATDIQKTDYTHAILLAVMRAIRTLSINTEEMEKQLRVS